MTSIGIDRYYTIIYPLSFKVTRATAKRMIIASVVMGVFLSAFCFYFYESVTVTLGNNVTKTVCPVYIDPRNDSGLAYTIISTVLQFGAPFFILVILYIGIFNFIWKINFRFMRIQRTTNHVPKAKVKMVKMLIIVTSGTVLLLLPLCIVSVWVTLARPSRLQPSISILVIWTALASIVYKPFIYTIFNSNFRRGCKEVFCMSSSRCYRRNTYAITTASAFSKKNHIGIMRSNSQRALESPSKVFDRSIQPDRTLWPLSTNGVPTTYIWNNDTKPKCTYIPSI